MLKAIKIRIYPSLEQISYINNLLGCSRFVYNNCLSYRIDKYNNEKINVGFAELGKYLTLLKKQEEYSFLNNVHSKVLQQSLINLEYAYKSFFKNNIGFPKFKSKKDNKQSCRFPTDAIGKINGNRINIIRKLKDIHFKCSKRDEIYLNKNQNNIKSATLIKIKSGNYYFSILIDCEINKILPKPINYIMGIDLGIKSFIITSNNEIFENLKLKKNNQKKLNRLHKQLSRKKIESNNRNKQRIKLAKYYEKLNNIKENYLHEVTNKLLNDNQIIVMENLNVNGMMKNHHLARSIQELSLNRFKSILEYKAKWYNKDIIQIDRFYPSTKICSNCTHKNNNLTLNDRTWKCTNCGTIHDRDYNAAKNILKEGKRILSIKENKIGLSSPELTLMDYPLIDDITDRNINALKSYDRLKQEKNELI